MDTKICNKCKIKKSIDEFHKCKKNSERLRTFCKKCTLKQNSNNYFSKHEYYKKKHLEYAKKEESKTLHKKWFSSYRLTEKAKKSLVKKVRLWENKNPIKKRAIYLIRQAIKNGNIKRQLECSVCGSSKLVSGHHDDYSKPLVVRWLCYLCHKKWHKENGSGLNG